MSAAAPLPPPGPRPPHAMNGYSNGASGPGADGWRGSNAGPQIAEITASATEKANEMRGLTVRSLCLVSAAVLTPYRLAIFSNKRGTT